MRGMNTQTGTPVRIPLTGRRKQQGFGHIVAQPGCDPRGDTVVQMCVASGSCGMCTEDVQLRIFLVSVLTKVRAALKSGAQNPAG